MIPEDANVSIADLAAARNTLIDLATRSGTDRELVREYLRVLNGELVRRSMLVGHRLFQAYEELQGDALAANKADGS